MWLVILSFGYVNALIPLLIIIILIAAAAGLTRGWDALKLFGIEALMGVGAAGKGSLRGKSAYKSKYVTTFSPSQLRTIKKKTSPYIGAGAGKTLGNKIVNRSKKAALTNSLMKAVAPAGGAKGAGMSTGNAKQPPGRVRMALNKAGQRTGINTNTAKKLAEGAALAATGVGAMAGLNVVRDISYDNKVNRYRAASADAETSSAALDAKQKAAFDLQKKMMEKGKMPLTEEERRSAADARAYLDRMKQKDFIERHGGSLYSKDEQNAMRRHLEKVDTLNVKMAELQGKTGDDLKESASKLSAMYLAGTGAFSGSAIEAAIGKRKEQTPAQEEIPFSENVGKIGRMKESIDRVNSRRAERASSIETKKKEKRRLELEREQQLMTWKKMGMSSSDIAREDSKLREGIKAQKVTRREKLRSYVDQIPEKKAATLALPITLPVYSLVWLSRKAESGTQKAANAAMRKLNERISRSGLKDTSDTRFDELKGEPEKTDKKFGDYWNEAKDHYKEDVEQRIGKGDLKLKAGETSDDEAKRYAFMDYRRITVGGILAAGTVDQKFAEPKRADYAAFDAVSDAKKANEEETPVTSDDIRKYQVLKMVIGKEPDKDDIARYNEMKGLLGNNAQLSKSQIEDYAELRTKEGHEDMRKPTVEELRDYLKERQDTRKESGWGKNPDAEETFRKLWEEEHERKWKKALEGNHAAGKAETGGAKNIGDE